MTFEQGKVVPSIPNDTYKRSPDVAHASTSIPGVVLAGGQSRRMGTGKAFVDLAGKPLINHVIDRVRPQCATLAINVNDDPHRFAVYNVPLLSDGSQRGRGPLAGILSAMEWAATLGAEKVLVAPVDTPFLPTDLVMRLQRANAAIALAQTECRVHGTIGVWHVELRTQLRKALDSGMRKVTSWAMDQGACTVRFENAHSFHNINSPTDLAYAEMLLRE